MKETTAKYVVPLILQIKVCPGPAFYLKLSGNPLSHSGLSVVSPSFHKPQLQFWARGYKNITGAKSTSSKYLTKKSYKPHHDPKWKKHTYFIVEMEYMSVFCIHSVSCLLICKEMEERRIPKLSSWKKKKKTHPWYVHQRCFQTSTRKKWKQMKYIPGKLQRIQWKGKSNTQPHYTDQEI